MSTSKSKRVRRGKSGTKQKIAAPPIAKESLTATGRARPGDFDKQVKKIRADMADIRANIDAAQRILQRHEMGKLSEGLGDEPPEMDLREGDMGQAAQSDLTDVDVRAQPKKEDIDMESAKQNAQEKEVEPPQTTVDKLKQS